MTLFDLLMGEDVIRMCKLLDAQYPETNPETPIIINGLKATVIRITLISCGGLLLGEGLGVVIGLVIVPAVFG